MYDLMFYGFCAVLVAVSIHVIGGMMYEVLHTEPILEARSWYDPGYFVEGQRVVD